MNPRFGLPLAILLGLVVRVPFWIEALRTPVDGDTAIVGLMARHPGQGTTLWGQPYGSPLESWLAAPFVAALGPTTEALRLFYFLLGLGLIPAAYVLAGRLDARGAAGGGGRRVPSALLPAALGPAAPALPQRAGAPRLRAGAHAPHRAPPRRPGAGAPRPARAAGRAGRAGPLDPLDVAGRDRGLRVSSCSRGRRAAASWWSRASRCSRAARPGGCARPGDPSATRIVSVSDRRQTTLSHLREVLPHLHEPLGGLLGSHVPMVADDPEFIVWSPRLVAACAIFIYGAGLVFAARSVHDPRVALLFGGGRAHTARVSVPAALRSRLPALPDAAVPAGRRADRVGRVHARARAPGLAGRARAVRPAPGGQHAAARRLAQAPTAAPRRSCRRTWPGAGGAERNGIRRAYASYGPAYRLTYEPGERIVASQPWNERFLHYPLPYLDEVRFAIPIAWVLTPRIPSDLPSPAEFEAALRAAGGAWRRTDLPGALVYHGFVPPYAAAGEPLASAGPAGDRRPGNGARPRRPRSRPCSRSRRPLPLDAVTLMAGLDGPPLLRSMDVEVSADGITFEKVAERRRRSERADLRWVNGHPQYVLDHDLLSIPLGGRTVMAASGRRPFASRRRLAAGRGLPAPGRRRRAPLGRRARSGARLDREAALADRQPLADQRGLVLPQAAGRAPLAQWKTEPQSTQRSQRSDDLISLNPVSRVRGDLSVFSVISVAPFR